MRFFVFLRAHSLTLLPVIVLGYIVAESYQIDYRAFHLAGKSILLGIDPYLNYVNDRPELYAPINAENSAYSAFRYPPLSAFFFIPFALFNYEISRILFSFAILTSLYWLVWRVLNKQSPNDTQLLTIILALLSFPIAATFQRGQVDLVLVCLTYASFELMNHRKMSIYAPILLAFAAILKIFPGFLALYFLLRKKFRAFGVFCGTTILLYLLPLPFQGQEVFHHFWQRTFPRIFGEIKSTGAIDVHSQKAIFFGSGNYIQAIEGTGKVPDRDYVGGGMNFLLKEQDLLAILVGCLIFLFVFYILRNQDEKYRFLTLINTINIFNPLAWLMGVVWYIPFFLTYFPKASNLWRGFMLLPLFFAPSLNSNAYLAVIIPVVYGLWYRDCVPEKMLPIIAKPN
jgi:Glycosyltransferase family 87